MNRIKPILALCAVVALACVSMLAGCASDEPKPENGVKADIAAQLDPVKNLDENAVNDLVEAIQAANDLETYGIVAQDYIRSMLAGFDYSVKDVAISEDGASATATVAITCKSFSDASLKASEKALELAQSGAMAEMSMDEMNKSMGSAMMEAMDETATKTTDCTFDYALEDGAWKVVGGIDSGLYGAFFA